jgi:hypothetical protein
MTPGRRSFRSGRRRGRLPASCAESRALFNFGGERARIMRFMVLTVKGLRYLAARTAGAVEEMVMVVMSCRDEDPTIVIILTRPETRLLAPPTKRASHTRWRTNSPSSLQRASTPSQKTTRPSPSPTTLPPQYTPRAYLISPCVSPQRSSRPSKALANFSAAERTSGKRRALRPPPQRKTVSASRVVKRLRMPPHPTSGARRIVLLQHRQLYPIRTMDFLAHP